MSELTTKKIIVIDGTRLSDIQSCYMRANYAHIKHLRVKGGSKALEMGQLMHAMLAVYYFGSIQDIKEHHKSHSLSRFIGLSRHDLIAAAIELGREESLSMS